MEINLSLTGWPGVGTSTLTLLLALILKQKYYNIGSVFRKINSEVFTECDLKLSLEWEQMIQPAIGKTVDNFVDYILLNKSGIILESDLSTFRIGKNPKVFSIFIKSNLETRKIREEQDGRKGKETSIELRDKALQQEYQKLWGVDIFDLDLIAKKYNLIIDNSSLSIQEEVEAILERVFNLPWAKSTNFSIVQSRSKRILEKYKSFDKKIMQKALKRQGLFVDSEVIMQEIVKTFPEEVQSFPDSIQKQFLGQK